jgi:hypothetical protein
MELIRGVLIAAISDLAFQIVKPPLLLVLGLELGLCAAMVATGDRRPVSSASRGATGPVPTVTKTGQLQVLRAVNSQCWERPT